MECIVLAGGLGTRLRGVIGEAPKCMAPVNGQPFLYYLLQYLQANKCSRVILSLGYKHEVITNWLRGHEYPFAIDHVIEHEPLGTGGGIQLAIKEARTENILVLNGDTMFSVDIAAMVHFHTAQNSETTLALKQMHDFDRYGVVRTNADNSILSFEEKKYQREGLINGGVYLINKAALLSKNLPAKFSFEKDYLEQYVGQKAFYGFKSDSYFIDIGIPADYEQAQHDFRDMF